MALESAWPGPSHNVASPFDLHEANAAAPPGTSPNADGPTTPCRGCSAHSSSAASWGSGSEILAASLRPHLVHAIEQVDTHLLESRGEIEHRISLLRLLRLKVDVPVH